MQSSVPQFVLGESVGKGSSCRVQRIYFISDKRSSSLDLCKKYCAKIVPIMSMSPMDKKCALEEVKILKNLPPHPHLLSLFISFELNSELFVVTNYCEGGDLHRYCRSRIMNETAIWVFLEQILSGLKHLHQHSILHRDIKTKVNNVNCIISGHEG
jgi:serine/threonine protein kinase